MVGVILTLASTPTQSNLSSTNWESLHPLNRALGVRLALDVLQLPPQRRVRVDLVRRLEDGLAPARGESVGL